MAYLIGGPYPAESEGMCNDGCGYWVEAGDAVVDSEIGPVLVDHPEED